MVDDSIKNIRKYGNAPYKVAVVHGGPGAPGEMAPVAMELSKSLGVLEPLQTTSSLEGQVEELAYSLNKYGSIPFTLIGFSWGAMLSYILTAKYPSLVKKLILVSSGVYQERYAKDIMTTRMDRFNDNDLNEVYSLVDQLNDPEVLDKNKPFGRFGELISKADSYDELPHMDEILEYQYEINQNVWNDALELRRSRKLLFLGNKIECPVIAIHGDYDPHPPEGISEPLAEVINNFRFILLNKCGHRPWLERYAKDRFYEILKEELE